MASIQCSSKIFDSKRLASACFPAEWDIFKKGIIL